MIDRYAKDTWRELKLQTTAPQNGYVQIEIGNGSKRPVWMDGMSMTTKGKPQPGAHARMDSTGTVSSDSLGLLPEFETEFTGPEDLPDGETVGDHSGGTSGGHGTTVCQWICVYTPYGSNCWEECTYYPPSGGYGDRSETGGGSNPTAPSGPGGGGGEVSQPTSVPLAKDRDEPKLKQNECEAIQELYYSSFNEDGSPYKENSAWITEAGVILLPNIKNTSGYSDNSALNVRPIQNGGFEIEYPKNSGNWYEIYAHIHTHPNQYFNDHRDARPGGANNSTNTADWNFAKQYPGLTNFIISSSTVYRYKYENYSYDQFNLQSNKGFLDCSKAFSNYFYY